MLYHPHSVKLAAFIALVWIKMFLKRTFWDNWRELSDKAVLNLFTGWWVAIVCPCIYCVFFLSLSLFKAKADDFHHHPAPPPVSFLSPTIWLCVFICEIFLLTHTFNIQHSSWPGIDYRHLTVVDQTALLYLFKF